MVVIVRPALGLPAIMEITPATVKSDRDLPGQVRAQACRGSREDPGALAQEMALDPLECANYIRGNDLGSSA